MKREEIEKMSAGVEMDNLVAQLIGMELNKNWVAWPPPFSANINCAWMVVEKIGRWRGFEFMIFTNYGESPKWHAGWFEVGYELESRVTSYDDNPALAICRAALLTIAE